MSRPSGLLSALCLTTALATLTGCSFSESSASVSSISESISESSSSKTGIGKEKVAYRDDIANLTYSVASSSMTADEFPTALARSASQFKISDWTQEKATFYGIGKGLKKAGVSKDDVAALPLLDQVIKTNKNALGYIQEGYKY